MGLQITLTVNGESVTREVEPQTLLVSFIRETLRLTGTHVGCDTGQCGACTVHIAGHATKSCSLLPLPPRRLACWASSQASISRRSAACHVAG